MNATPLPPLRKGKRILVVDDDPVVSKALYALFSSRGYDTGTAADGPQLVGALQRRRPDLIVLDLFFPQDVLEDSLYWDGFLMLAWLNSLGKAADIPVIVLSGFGSREYRKFCRHSGAAGFFVKPFNPRDLLATVETALENQPSKTLASAC